MISVYINLVCVFFICRKQMHVCLLTGGVLDLAAGIAGDHPKAVRRRFVGRDPETRYAGLICGRRRVRSLEPAERNEVGFQLHTLRGGVRIVGRIGFCDLALGEGHAVDHGIRADNIREGRIARILALIVCKPLIDSQTDVVGCRRHLSSPYQGIIARVVQKRVDIREVEMDICAFLLIVVVDLIDQVLETADDLLRRRCEAVRAGVAAVEPFLQIGKQGMENVVCADLDEDLLNARDLKRIHLEARRQCRALQRALELSRAILKQLVALDSGGNDGGVVDAVFLEVILKHVRDRVGDGGVADEHHGINVRSCENVQLLEHREQVVVAFAFRYGHQICRVAHQAQSGACTDVSTVKPCCSAGQRKVTNRSTVCAVNVDNQVCADRDIFTKGEVNGFVPTLRDRKAALSGFRSGRQNAAGIQLVQAALAELGNRDRTDLEILSSVVVRQRHAEVLAAQLRLHLDAEGTCAAFVKAVDCVDCRCRLTVFFGIEDTPMPRCDPVL